MDIFAIIITVLGLSVFEIISSVDNAVINAEVLSTMSERAKKWFLTWGLFFAVFVVRGMLPWLIIWLATPGLGPLEALSAAFSNDPAVIEAVERSAPILLAGGGVFLALLFLHWLFVEPKKYGFVHEEFFHYHGVWFYAASSAFLSAMVWFALKQDPMVAFGAVVGSTVFFITHGFKQNAEAEEARLVAGSGGVSDLSKLFYLEAIDTTFSIDGVLGAFAFTLAVPLIVLGNGLGALVLRQLTMKNIDRVKEYAYLKNGAMYSVAVLGCVMLAESFRIHVSSLIAPLSTFVILGYFLWRSVREKKIIRVTV
jgi:hypothetical protein